jgi:translation initiation factor IF-3
VPTVRLIDENDQQLGVVDVRDAIQKAREAGMDLVEVAPQSVPPVCRIMDYGKWMYSQRKKEQKAKSHRHETELKEIRIRTPKIGDHDLDIKLGHARDFLSRGDRVQFSLRFRGRELAHIDEGRRIFDHIKKGLEDISRVDQDFRFEGRRLTMTLAAGAKKPPEKPGEKPAAKPAAAKPADKPAPRPAVEDKPATPPPPQA